jgi:CubicO group peptidase (beta-lactamase class C family)
VEALAQLPLEFQPGSSWKYSNSGYNLLGFVIENVSGKSYWDFMYERIFKPLNMTSTTNRLPAILISNRASGYEQTNHILINRDSDLTDVFSAGAFVSTVGDLAKWNAALDSTQILTAASKQEMWTPQKLTNGESTKYGFGWRIDELHGHRNIGHGGSTSGFSATLQRFPDDHLAIIILSNTDEQLTTAMAKRIAMFYLK